MTETMIDYEAHELASIMPEMAATEYLELRADIGKVGLQVPITLYEGKVLDGRHRQRACKELGIDGKFVALGSDIKPLEFVISSNLKRRHLSLAQRAVIALSLKDKMLATRKGPYATGHEESRPLVAKIMQVGLPAIAKVSSIKNKNPKLLEKVLQGEISIKKAWLRVRTPRAKEPLTLTNAEQALKAIRGKQVDGWNIELRGTNGSGWHGHFYGNGISTLTETEWSQIARVSTFHEAIERAVNVLNLKEFEFV